MTLLLPAIFFSGFIFPRETMPWIFYASSTVLPATCFIDLMRAIILRGAAFADFGTQLLVPVTMGVVLFTLCTLVYRRAVGLSFLLKGLCVLPKLSASC